MNMTLSQSDVNAISGRRPRASFTSESSLSPTPDTSETSTTTTTPTDRDNASSGSFVTKLYRMVDSEPTAIVSWIRGGTAFCIVDPKAMAEYCLPKYFRHRRFSSLIRQLNFYSFYRVQEGQLTIYQHSFFRKGRPDLLVHIRRRGAGKAKDPWFDPLASKMHGEGIPPRTSICYSPMSKPLSIENMSPALKPSLAPLTPPVVSLNGSEVTIPPMYGYGSTKSHSPLIDINVQDFLTDECSIQTTLEEEKEMNDTNGSATRKRVIVARDCLKLEPCDSFSNVALSREDQVMEEEILLDLATVEPGTWEVPLSPLNDEEDVMPWIDLCF